MTDTVHQRHNKLFSEYFGRSDVARDFVQHYLPRDIVAHLDVTSLDIRKDRFIDDKLAEHFSDLLYQIDMTTGESAYIYILFDHKSYVDSWVAFQLLRYMVRIWEMSLQEQQAARKDQPDGQKKPLRLPPIMPLVVYHGEESWYVSQEFSPLFGDKLPEALRFYLPNYRYWLWNLRDIPPDGIVGGVLLRVVALLLKYANSEELEARLPEILALLRELEDKSIILHNLRIILRYLSGGKHPLNDEELQETVDKLLAGGDFMPTFIEKKIEQALQEGFQKGEQVGLLKGEQVGLLKGEQVGLLKGRSEGLQEGRQEGQRLTQIKNIKLTLAVRFEVELESYEESLNELSLSDLEELLRVALQVQEVTEFDAVLAEMMKDNDNESSVSKEAG